MKFFGYTMGDPNAPAGPPDPEMYGRMSAFVEEATKSRHPARDRRSRAPVGGHQG